MFHVKRAALLPLAFAFALALVLASAARAADPEAASLAIRAAEQRYAEGDFSGAADAARAALEDEAGSPRALDLLRRALEASGDDEAAEKEIRKALEAAGENASGPALALADFLLERRPAEAADLYARALSDPKTRFSAASGLARAYLLTGRARDAETTLRALFEDYRSLSGEGLTAADFRALARAALAAEDIPALRREHVRPFAKDARDFYQRAWKLSQKDPDILVEWGELFLQKWDIAEARRLAKEALKRAARHPGAHVLFAESTLRDLFGGTEKFDEAREAIDAALAQNPRCARAYVLRAKLFLTDALYDEALAALDRALALRPLDIEAAAQKAGIFLLRGDEAEAKKIEAEVIARGPRPGAEFATDLAAMLDAKFRYREAYARAREAIERDPEYWRAWSQLGLAAMRVGDERQAHDYLAKAAEADPFDLFTSNLLTLLRYIEKEFVTTKTERFILRVHKDEAAALGPEALALLERCWSELSGRYGVELDSPVLVEFFPRIEDFSVRAVAHPFIPASGVTFARVVAVASPHALPPGSHGWGRVLWHELAHVATLERSGYRVPRWLTEGISVFEESKGHRAWTREWDEMLVDALARGQLLPIRELNEGFSKPKFPHQVMLSYFQGGLTCQFIEKTWGFRAILALLDGYRAAKPLDRNLADACGGISPEEFDRRFLLYARETFGDALRAYRPACRDERDLSERKARARARPQEKEAIARYALGAADMRRAADAETWAGRLEKLDPESGDARLVRAMVAEQRRQPEKAAALAAEALARGTQDPLRANLMIAGYYAEKDEKSGARRDLRKAIAAFEAAHALFERSPGPVEALVALYKEAGEAEKHVEMVSFLAEIRPNDVGARFELATRAFEARDQPRFCALVEEMMLIDPLNAGVEALEAARLVFEKKFDEAKKRLDLARSLVANKKQAEELAPLFARVEAFLAEGRAGSPAPAGTPHETSEPKKPGERREF
jgi:tetratricopeptide (TPR) repeat protein